MATQINLDGMSNKAILRLGLISVWAMKSGLRGNRWKETAIKRHLGDPDGVRHYPPKNSTRVFYRKDRPERFFDAKRVEVAEALGLYRIRKPRRQNADLAYCIREYDLGRDIVDRLQSLQNRREKQLQPGCELSPDEPWSWMPVVYDYATEAFGIKAPWRIEKMALTTGDRKMHVWIGHARARFACPRCRRPCSVYDHTRETVWPKRGPAIIHCRRPRIQCPKDGILQIRPLARAAKPLPELKDDERIKQEREKLEGFRTEWVIEDSIK
jgi:hypothetical protein